MAEKKKFHSIEVPLLNEKVEVLAENIDKLEGKTIKLDMTRKLRGKSIEITLKIHYRNNKLETSPKKLELMKFFIRRMMKKGISYVEDSFSTESKNSVLRIKPFMLTRKKVSRAIRKELRDKARDFLMNYAKTRTTEDIFSDIINNKLQKELSLKLKKIYPLALCEIRILEVEKPLAANQLKVEEVKIQRPEKMPSS
jgi:ribosomal protein S3AE